MIDTDGSGTITFDEQKNGLKRVGSELMESEIQSLIDAVDIDNNGTIDYGEFIAATVHMNKLEREENLVNAFSFFDKDGSGYITIDEQSQACKDMGLGDTHLDEMIRETDQNNIATPLREMVVGAPLEDAQQLAKKYDKILHEVESQIIEVSRFYRLRDGLCPCNDFWQFSRKIICSRSKVSAQQEEMLICLETGFHPESVPL